MMTETMTEGQREMARRSLEAAEKGSMTFPEIVQGLMEAGFESYMVDYRRGVVTYYLPDGGWCEVGMEADEEVPVAAEFDAATVVEGIREAQGLVPGYSYRGFCRKVKGAGCAGYLVSFSGKRVLYFGRTGETHVEEFKS